MLCCLLKHYFLRTNPWKEKQEVDFVVRFSFCSSAQLHSNVQLFMTQWSAAMPGFPVHHQLLELAQTHSGAIQPSYPLSSPIPPAFSLSQYQGLF